MSGSSLFFQGVEALLRQETELEIVGREADMNLALERIRTVVAEVVIVDFSDVIGDPGPAEEHLLGACLLAQGPSARVVGLSIMGSTMCIFRGEKRRVQCVADLVAAIEEPQVEGEP